MTKSENLKQEDGAPGEAYSENAALRIALRQAQEFSINKEKKSIEYIFHLGQFKTGLFYRIARWLKGRFGETRYYHEKERLHLLDQSKNYADWLARYDCVGEDSRSKIIKHIRQFKNSPYITLILDCRCAEIDDIYATIKSLNAQIYQKFELILCGDRARLGSLTSFEQSLQDSGLKINMIELDEMCSLKDFLHAAALEIAGDYAALVAAGDKLHETAFYELAAELDLYPGAQALYVDEDELETGAK
jgi:hypothetical protein